LNDHDVWCPRCNGRKVLKLKKQDGTYGDAECATCQGQGQIPAWYQLQRFDGKRYSRQRRAMNMSPEQRAFSWGCPVDMVKDLEAGLIRPPFFAPLDPVVTMVLRRDPARDVVVATAPRRRDRD
jgi:hypothetical protein